MKNVGAFVFPFLISLFISGCAIKSSHEFSLEGNRAVARPNYFIKLDANAGNGFDATCFTLTFIGREKPVTISAIHGSYQYNSKPIQPLELSHLSQSNAVFVPTAELFVTKSPQNIVQYVRMNYGLYDLYFQYVINDETNSCNFKVDYISKTKLRIGFPIENGLKFYWYMLHAEPGD
jgi:hypothetical protein